MVGGKPGHQARRAAAEIEVVEVAHPADQRLRAQRPDLPGRDVQELPSGEDRRAGVRARTRFRGRAARSQPSHLGVRPQHPSLQGLRIDSHAALPLAVLLLSQPFAGPAQRLDERDLSDVGGRPRRHDRDTGQLVSGARGIEGDDRSSGLRRRRQPGSDLDRRQGCEEGQGDRTEGLGLSAPSRRPGLLGRRARRCRRHRNAAPHPGRLAEGHGPGLGRPCRRARPLCRLLRALCHQPRRARSRQGASRRRRATPRAPWSRP